MTSPGFEVRSQRESDAIWLVITGELDIATEPQLSAAAKAAVDAEGVGRLIVDLGGVPFMDSAGLRALLLARAAAQQRGLIFELAVRPGPITRLFSIAGVTNWFTYADVSPVPPGSQGLAD